MPGAGILLGVVLGLMAAPLPDCPEGMFPLGPVDAPVTVEAFIDPVRSNTLTTVLELRRLVGEQGGQLRVVLRLAPLASSTDPQSAWARRWVTAAALEGSLLPAIRILDRDGIERTYADIINPADDASAGWTGLDSTRVLQTLDGPCPDLALARALEVVRAKGSRSSLPTGPVFIVDDRLLEGDDDLAQLRPAIARTLNHRMERLRGDPPPAAPPLKGVSQPLVRPDFPTGVTVGGPALRHRLLVFVKDEDDPNLFLTLPEAFAYRSRHPGVLSVQIVGRGDSTLTELLSRRLCAANVLGSELEYARYLAKDSSERRSPSRLETRLLDSLDETAEEHCQPPPEVDLPPPSVPDGPWLDGTPRSRGDLENLETSLYLLEAASRPLDSLLSAAARPTP